MSKAKFSESVKENIKPNVPIRKRLLFVFVFVMTIPLVIYLYKVRIGNKAEVLDNNMPSVSIVDFGQSLPKNLPPDFPIVDDSTVLNASGTTETTGGLSVVWETDVSVNEVVSFYQNKLIENSYSVVQSAIGEGVNIEFEKYGVYGFLVIISQEKTLITLAMRIE